LREAKGIPFLDLPGQVRIPEYFKFVCPPSSGGPNPDRKDFRQAAFVFLATVAACLPSLAGRFIWNDSDYVTRPELRTLAGLGRIWAELGATEQYYPLLHSAFWVQHRLWGDHPLGYHIVTVLMHAGSAVLFPENHPRGGPQTPGRNNENDNRQQRGGIHGEKTPRGRCNPLQRRSLWHEVVAQRQNQ